MKKLRLIEVPMDSKDHFINNIGCLRSRRMEGTFEVSSCIEPHEMGVYLTKEEHSIVGYTELEGKKYIVIENL